jgi:hypothetical protein
LAKYAGQGDIDAVVVELVPPGGSRTEPIGTLAPMAEAARPLRSRAEGGGAGLDHDHTSPAVDDGR